MSAPAESKSELPTRAPERLGRYRIEKEVASGGMASVYLGRATGPAGFEKLLAIKCIHPHLARKQDFVQMFLDEARVAAQIQHPNVCTVFEVGDDGGTYYLAMEYLLGETVAHLAQRIHGRPKLRSSLTFGRLAARIIADACRGLHAAHELRNPLGEPLHIIHRDATPSNLFVSYEGHIKVVDFGVAKAADQLHETGPQTAKGKIAYMAPEQLQNLALDRRIDVWGMGVSLWELCAQKRLFSRSSKAAALRAILDEPIPSAKLGTGDAPAELASIVARALSRNPADRYPSTLAMGRDLEAFISATGPAIGEDDVSQLMRGVFAEEEGGKRAFIAGLSREPTSGRTPVPESLPPPATPDGSGLVPMRRPRRWLPIVAAVALLITIPVVGLALFPGDGAETGSAPGSVAEEPSTVESAPANAPPASNEGTTDPSSNEVAVASADRSPDEPPVAPEADTPPASGETGRGRDTSPAEDTAGDPPPRETRQPTRESGRRERSRGPTPTPARHPVSITTPGGWGEVRIDGRPYGRTPLRVDLPAGRHTITIRPPGGSTIRRVIRVPSTRRVRVSLRGTE
ncbi:MAG: protein kinase [Myxococcota bacterium]